MFRCSLGGDFVVVVVVVVTEESARVCPTPHDKLLLAQRMNSLFLSLSQWCVCV